MQIVKNGKIKKPKAYASSKAINWFGEKIFSPIAKEIAKEGFRIGYHSNGDGTNGEMTASIGPIQVGTNTGASYNGKSIVSQTKTNPTKPAAYSRTTAAKASDIAQGGMTKDEVEEFNERHPNETANIRG